MGNWSTGLKLALSVLGVVLFATAIQTFVNWQPSSKFGAGLFTIGAALMAGVVGAKFLPKGATSGLLVAGLALGGYQMVGDKVIEFGENIGNSIRGKGGAISATPPRQADGKSYDPNYGKVGTPTGIVGTVPQSMVQQQPVSTGGAAGPTYVTIQNQAAKPPSTIEFLGGKLFDTVGAVFAGAGTKLLGSAGNVNDAFAKVG